MKKLILILFIWVALGNFQSLTAQDNNSNERIQTILDSLQLHLDLPAIHFSLIGKDGKLYNYKSGYAVTESRGESKFEHQFLSGSIGKTYAAAIIFQLIDENKIKLSDRIISFFPDTKWLKRLANIDSITIEMLLKHTSGLPRWVLKPEIWEVLNNNTEKLWSYRDRFSYIFDEPAVHEAGKAWAYSDTNYLLLGMLIEELTEPGYYEYLNEFILTPNGLKETSPSNKRAITNLIDSYSKLPETFKIPDKASENNMYVFNPQVEWTGGGMASTTGDLAKWCKLYFESSLFSKAISEQMREEHELGQNVMAGNSYGMGCFIYHTKMGVAYGHSGFMPGFNSIMAYFPKDEIAVALQFNCDYAGSKLPLTSFLEILMKDWYNKN